MEIILLAQGGLAVACTAASDSLPPTSWASVPWLDAASPVTPRLVVDDLEVVDDPEPPVTPDAKRTGGALQCRYAPYMPHTPPLDGAQTA